MSELVNKIYINKFNMSYYEIKNILGTLVKNNSSIIKKESSCKTFFGYDLDSYVIGNGKKHVLFIGATHSLEIITIYFVLDLMINIIEIMKKDSSILSSFTFHFIPILNPEGSYITLQNIYMNLKGMENKEIEIISKKYLDAYNLDDENVLNNIKCKKSLYNVLDCRLEFIDDIYLRESVRRILKNCMLDERYLLVWAANGLGIDLNSNSIHKFNQIKILRKTQKCAALRYNDIPVTRSSPMSYPGEFTFDRCIENKYLYDYINNLYINKDLKNIFSFHSTGGQIFGFPDEEMVSEKIIKRYDEIVKLYSYITGYEIMEDENKVGVMDYFRVSLKNTITLTIELSKYNANPIGPLFNICKLEEDFIKNKEAIFSCIFNK